MAGELDVGPGRAEAGGLRNLHGDHERLSKQSFEFVSPPKEQFYGIEAVVKDNSGNWFSLTQRKN